MDDLASFVIAIFIMIGVTVLVLFFYDTFIDTPKDGE